MAPEAPTTGTTAPKLFDAGWLKQALTYVGVAGVGGGGFAALCFGIGFLAIRHHDEMLGLPSRTTAYGAMVRAGALFFPNSLYYVLIGTWKAVAVLFVLALMTWPFQDAIAGALRACSARLPVAVRNSSNRVSFLLVHALLLGLGLMLFEDRAAMLHPTNRHLLLDRPATRAATLANPAPLVASASAGSLRYFAWERLSKKAARIGAELRSDAEITRRHYGQSVALLGLLVALLVFELVFWRELSLLLLRWLLRPILYVLTGALIITLPAAYGVLWIPNNATYVEITTAATSEPPVTGYLLTDISGDEPDVWTLTLADTTFAMRVFKRESISEIRVLADASTENLLGVSPEPSEPAAHPDERGGASRAGPPTQR